MILFIPMATGQIVKDGVFESINMQTMKATVYTGTTDGLIKSHRDYRSEPLIIVIGHRLNYGLTNQSL